LLVWHFASLHFAKKAKMTLLKREERACYLEHHKLAKQKLQKCYLFFLVSKSKLIMCKVSTNSFIYTSHRQSQVTHRVRMR